MGLGGPNLVKGAVGQVIDAESLGGAKLHTGVSGVAHYRALMTSQCLEMIRQQFRQFDAPRRNCKAVSPARVRKGLRHSACRSSFALPCGRHSGALAGRR